MSVGRAAVLGSVAQRPAAGSRGRGAWTRRSGCLPSVTATVAQRALARFRVRMERL